MAAARVAPVQPERQRRPTWGILLPWVVTAAILVGTAVIAFWPREPELRTPVKPGQEGALIWGDGIFTDASQLEAWLKARGVSYKQWAQRHPDAVRLLAPPPEGAARPAPPANEAAPTPAVVDQSLTSRRSLTMLGLLALLGGALALPVSRFVSRDGRASLRTGLVVSMASVALGAAVASLLS